MRKGEDGILDLLGKYFPNSHPQMPMGRGDDCALITVPFSCDNVPVFAVTSDIFAENAHFRTTYFTPEEIGHKALAVNISDLAGNGASPLAFSLNLTLTENQNYAWLEKFFQGMAKLAQQYNMVLCGGDLTKVPVPTLLQEKTKAENLDPYSLSGLNIGITAWGTYQHQGMPLMRHRAYTKPQNIQKPIACMKQGDILFYIGEIGLARTGFYLLEEYGFNEQGKKLCMQKYPHAIKAHLMPEPKVKEGIALSLFAKEHKVFAMDISDGLMRDVPRLLACEGLVLDDEKTFGANITLKQDNIHAEIIAYCQEKNIDPLSFAYKGGEDYGLLGVCAEEAFPLLQAYWQKENLLPIQYLGKVTEKNIMVNNQEIKEVGFDHFEK